MDPAKILEARKAGYSDTEILQYLGASDPKIQAARDAGYKDNEILGHLAPAPSLGERAWDAAKGVGSEFADFGKRAGEYRDSRLIGITSQVVGLPRLAAHGLEWLDRKVGFSPDTGKPNPLVELLPTAQEAKDWMTGVAKNAPVPPGGTPWRERSIHPVVDAGVEAMASPLRITGFAAPAINFAGGAGGEALGEAAHEYMPDFETPARIIGSLLGGGMGWAGVKGAQKATGAAKGVIAPFTESGREGIVGKALTSLADDPARALANIEAHIAGQDAFPSATPGFRLTTSKAAKDDALMATENAMNVPGSGFGMRVRQNNEALTAALDRLDAGMDPRAFVAELAKQDAGAAMRAQAALDALPAGADAATAGAAIQNALRGRYDGLRTARTEATAPLYEAARNDPTTLKPFPLLAGTADAVAASKGELKTTAQKVRGLLFDANGKADRTVPGMMATRDAINDMIDAASPAQQRMLMGFRDQADDVLSAVPAERTARQTFADMSRPLDVFSAEKGFPFAANVIEKDRFGGNFMLPAERVPTQFFKPGDAGAATMKEFMAANGGNADAIASMKSFIADKARSADNLGGFLMKHRAAIDTLDPALAGQLESAAATGKISTGYRASPAGKFLDGDIDKTVRSTLNAADATKRMQALRMSVGDSPEAVQGLQKAVLDDFRKQAVVKTAEDASGNGMLTANGAEGWLRANRGAVANVLTPEQLSGLEAITRAVKDQSQTAIKTAGSDTSRNLATRSIVDALLWKGANEVAWLHPLQKTIGLAAGGADAKTLELMTQALLEPRVAAALMKKATPQNAKLAEPLLVKLLTATAGAVSRPREERGAQ